MSCEPINVIGSMCHHSVFFTSVYNDIAIEPEMCSWHSPSDLHIRRTPEKCQ